MSRQKKHNNNRNNNSNNNNNNDNINDVFSAPISAEIGDDVACLKSVFGGVVEKVCLSVPVLAKISHFIIC